MTAIQCFEGDGVDRVVGSIAGRAIVELEARELGTLVGEARGAVRGYLTAGVPEWFLLKHSPACPDMGDLVRFQVDQELNRLTYYDVRKLTWLVLRSHWVAHCWKNHRQRQWIFMMRIIVGLLPLFAFAAYKLSLGGPASLHQGVFVFSAVLWFVTVVRNLEFMPRDMPPPERPGHWDELAPDLTGLTHRADHATSALVRSVQTPDPAPFGMPSVPSLQVPAPKPLRVLYEAQS